MSSKTVEEGSFSTQLTASGGLKDIDSAAYGFDFTKGNNQGEREAITESEANDLIRMENNIITIDNGLGKRELAETFSTRIWARGIQI